MVEVKDEPAGKEKVGKIGLLRAMKICEGLIMQGKRVKDLKVDKGT